MLTYNSSQFTQDTWAAYRDWFRALVKRLAAHAWAACREHSFHAHGDAPRYHAHGYLFWKSGDGLIRRNTDDLVFEHVRPRVDLCTRTNPMRLHGAATQGLYYVCRVKMGTAASAANYEPWRDYTP